MKKILFILLMMVMSITTVYAQTPSITVNIEIENTAIGTYTNKEFEFTAISEDATTPLTTTIKGSGTGVIPIVLNEVGDRSFTVTQTTKNEEGWALDTSQYTVFIRVMNDETGTLSAVVTITAPDGNKVDKIKYQNSYMEKQVPVVISKVDVAGKELPGAEISIKKPDGTEVAKWTSSDKPYELSLEPGEYIFHEEAAPNGYVAVTDITFTVDKDGNVTITNTNSNAVKSEGNKLIVTDQLAPAPETPTPPETPKTPDAPNTGDNTNVIPWIGVMLVCVGFTGLLLKKSK